MTTKYERFAGSALEAELYRMIEAKQADIARSMLGGSLKSWEDYRHWTGYAAALKDMNEMIVAARKKVNL